jgi:hypothetical protein
VPSNYSSQYGSLPSLAAYVFPANATPEQIDEELNRIRADPVVHAIESSGQGFMVVPDAYTHQFIWINSRGPVATQ